MKLRYTLPMAGVIAAGILWTVSPLKVMRFETIREKTIQAVNTLVQADKIRLLERHTCSIRTSKGTGALICAVEPGMNNLLAVEIFGIGGETDSFTIQGISVEDGDLDEKTGCLRLKKSAQEDEIGENCDERRSGYST